MRPGQRRRQPRRWGEGGRFDPGRMLRTCRDKPARAGKEISACFPPLASRDREKERKHDGTGNPQSPQLGGKARVQKQPPRCIHPRTRFSLGMARWDRDPVCSLSVSLSRHANPSSSWRWKRLSRREPVSYYHPTYPPERRGLPRLLTGSTRLASLPYMGMLILQRGSTTNRIGSLSLLQQQRGPHFCCVDQLGRLWTRMQR